MLIEMLVYKHLFQFYKIKDTDNLFFWGERWKQFIIF